MKRLVLGAGLGAALTWFLDPRSGPRRRNVTRDRTLAFFRHGGRRVGRVARGLAAEVYGARKRKRLSHLHEEPKDFDDVTLAHKVETEIFRDADVPKGKINVNAEHGRIYLRGEVSTPEMINDLIDKARQVQGVREVESLLHVPTN
jgi:osmotically-inducible protein OsmY